MLEEYKNLMMNDIYIKLYEILEKICIEYDLDFKEIHNLYLKEFKQI